MSDLPDGLVRVVQAIASDDDLWLWYESLADVHPSERARELRATAARMEGLNDQLGIAHAIGMLAAPGLYESALEAVRQLRAE